MSYSCSGPRCYLRCNRYAHTGGLECQSNATKVDPIEEYVFEEVRTALLDPTAFAEARREQSDNKALDEEIVALNGELTKAKAAWKRWDHLFEVGGITADEMLRHRERLLGQTGRLQQRREGLEHEQSALDRAVDQIATVSEIADRLQTLSPTELREKVYSPLIKSIELRQGESPRIIWL